MPEQDSVNWKDVFEVAASQRDEATRNLHNLQLELILERKKNAELQGRLKELEDEGLVDRVEGVLNAHLEGENIN